MKLVKVGLIRKRVVMWIIVIFLVMPFILSLMSEPLPAGKSGDEPALTDIKDEKVAKVEVEEEKILITYKDKEGVYESRKEAGESFVDILSKAEIDPTTVQFENKDMSSTQAWKNIMEILLPVVLTGLIFCLFLNKPGGRKDGLFSFGRSKAKLFMKGKQDVEFADVAEWMRQRWSWRKLWIFSSTRKIYQHGGKNAQRGDFSRSQRSGENSLGEGSGRGSGRDVFLHGRVGIYGDAGRSRREPGEDLFDTAKRKAPAIIFIDEIDAIGRQRSRALTGGHDEREQTLNQILVEMDGFAPNQQVIVMAATNRGDLLDPALIRPGRFDRRIVLDMPDIEGRKRILAIHAKNKPFEADVNWDKIAKRTVGFSGADLENMLNEAAIMAARVNKKAINMVDLEEAALKVKLGPEKN